MSDNKLNIVIGGGISSHSAKEQIPLNTDKDGCCSCLKANYYKMGVANFIRHQDNGLKATCIMEIEYPS